MAVTFRRLTVKCDDAISLARFWGAVLECPVEPGGDGVSVALPEGNNPSLIHFIEVPSGEQVENRLRIELNPLQGALTEEIERLVKLGAVRVEERRRIFGLRWFVMADPEGNEFCVESSDREVAEIKAEIEADD